MKLEPKAKPVRIRIKSGGEEHFSLDSLKRNFSVQDLWEAVRGKSLSRWLRQQNETELADNVDAYREIEKPTIEEYVGFSNMFYKDNSFGDVNSLIDYYQSKGLQRNLQYVIVYVFDSLDYEKGKTWFHTFRRMKRDVEWADFFEHRLDALNDMDVVDCHQLLATLYNDMGEEKKKIFHLKKASAQLNIMAKSNSELLPNLLEIGDYQCVKSLFDDPVTQGKVETKKWIEAFRRCKDSLTGYDQGECLYILSTLYEKVQDNIMSKMCLKMAESVGFKVEKKETQDSSGRTGNSLGISRVNSGSSSSGFRYPELVSLFRSYKNRIKKNQLNQIASKIWDLVIKYKNQKHYENCYYCINMFLEIQSDKNYSSISTVIKRRAQEIQRPDAEIPLVFLVAGLAWEEKNFNTALFRQNGGIKLRSFYKTIVEAKSMNQYIVITTKNGLSCNTAIDSPIDQMVFFMMSYNEDYQISNTWG